MQELPLTSIRPCVTLKYNPTLRQRVQSDKLSPRKWRPHSRSSASQFNIEPVTLNDTKSLSKLECKIYGHRWHPYANWFWKRAADYMLAYKAVYGEKIVGGVVAFPTRQGKIYVDTLFVDIPFQGMGIGESLLETVMLCAGDSKILLDTWSFNRKAKRLFENHGFSPKRTLRNYYEEGIDYVLLELENGRNGKAAPTSAR